MDVIFIGVGVIISFLAFLYTKTKKFIGVLGIILLIIGATMGYDITALILVAGGTILTIFASQGMISRTGYSNKVQGGGFGKLILVIIGDALIYFGMVTSSIIFGF